MKRTAALAAIALLFSISPLIAQGVPSADRVIQKVAKKLASTRHLGYKYHFAFTERGEEGTFEERAQAFLDLQPPDATSRFRFQFDSAEKSTIYNGIERFTLDKKQKQMAVQNKPSFPPFGDILLHNSPLALRYALPKIAADPSVPKKVTLARWEGREVYVIDFSLPNQIINLQGDIIESKPPASNDYQIKVDKSTLLPVEVVHAIAKDAAIFKTTYADITEKPVTPSDGSWFYSSYTSEYTLKKKSNRVLIESAKAAPEFTLSRFESSEKISLDQYKGKLLLLDFWIVNCGYCFQSVASLNELYKKYRDKGLEIVSINMYDPPEAITKFKKKTDPGYTIVTGGDSIAAAYGVDAYPSVVLVGDSGKVLYSSKGVEEKELEAAITSNLRSTPP